MFDPQVAVDPTGNALAIWTTSGTATSGTPTQTYAARYVKNGSWGSIEDIDTCGPAATAASGACSPQVQGNLLVSSPRLAIDTEGNAIAMWVEEAHSLPQPPYLVTRPYANRYVAAPSTPMATHSWVQADLQPGAEPARINLEAKRLLAHTVLPVAVIGERLGFADPTNFGKFFVRTVGCSPGRFRRRQIANAPRG